MWEYKLRSGSYCLEDAHGNTVYTCDLLAMVFDPELGVLHHHGSPALVAPYFEQLRKVFPGCQMLIVDKRVPLEEINRCLSISGYIKRFVEKMSAAS